MSERRPEEVFTPRKASVNARMYIERPELERALLRELAGTQHVVIHGDSGCGKSWLYKRVLAEQGVHYRVANLASASRLNSITSVFADVVNSTGTARPTGFTERRNAELGGIVAKATLEHQAHHEYGAKDPFEAVLSLVRSEAGQQRAVLVLDNLERIHENSERMKELGDILTLLDDERYDSYNVKLLIVGTPTGLKDFFAQTPDRATIANRLTEVPEVGRMQKAQVHELVNRGFTDLLRVNTTQPYVDQVANHVDWVTMGISQHVQEYCLQLAFVAQDQGWFLYPSMTELADQRWLSNSLTHAYTSIQAAMTKREADQRRDRLLYALSRVDRREFKKTDVQGALKKHFPTQSADPKWVSTVLGAFVKEKVLRVSPTKDAFLFVSPQARMCLRAMLRKEQDGTVTALEQDPAFGKSPPQDGLIEHSGWSHGNGGMSVALELLEAARDGHLDLAERATGYRWGDPSLRAHVRKLLDAELARSEDQQDSRFVQLARRFMQ